MATIAKAKPATVSASASLVTIKGANKAARETAFLSIAPLSYVEAKSRTETIANLRVALGKAPSADMLKVAQQEYAIGRIAQRLTTLPKGVADDGGSRLEFARDLLLHYAAPAKDGVAARKLRKGQKGRRTIDQHKVCRAADEAWSQIKAELGLGAAKTQAERNKAKRSPAPQMAGATNKGAAGKDAAGKAGAGVTHSELVKADGPMTADAAREYLNSMAATLLAFGNKHAAIIPTDYGTAIRVFKTSCDKASIAYAARVK